MNKFYSEWREIIYTDLANTPARVSGKEVLKTEELTRYNIASLRARGSDTSLTFQGVDVYKTGPDKVGFFGKGVTKTTIYDPQYEKFVSTTQTFTTSGYIPNIREGITIASKGLRVSPENYYSGLGTAKYMTNKEIIDINFISAAKDQGEFYNIIGAKNPTKAFTTYNTGEKTFTYRGTFDSAGVIYKLPGDQGISNLIITGNKKSSQSFFNQLYGVGGAGSVEVTKQAQVIELSNVAKPLSSVGIAGISVQGVNQVASLINIERPSQQVQAPQQRNVLTYTLPTINQMLPQQENQSQGMGYGFANYSIAGLTGKEIPAIVPMQVVLPGLAQRSSLKMGLINAVAPSLPGYFNTPNVPAFTEGNYGFPFIFNLNPIDVGMPSNIVRGGKRQTSYTPSFSAIFFKIKGSYAGGTLGKSGIDFRPITAGFKFKTGLGGINLRKILKK